MRGLQQAAKDPHETNVTVLQTAASPPILRLSVSVRVVFGLAVVYLMIGKPEWVEWVLALSVAPILAAPMAVARRPAASRWRDPEREGGPSPAARSAD